MRKYYCGIMRYYAVSGKGPTGCNGLAWTLMLEQVPAENSTGKRGRSLGGIFYGNSLDVREFFGFILLMAVPIMKTEPLKLDVIRRGHNSDTALALASMAHWTTKHIKLTPRLSICDRASFPPSYSVPRDL